MIHGVSKELTVEQSDDNLDVELHVLVDNGADVDRLVTRIGQLAQQDKLPTLKVGDDMFDAFAFEMQKNKTYPLGMLPYRGRLTRLIPPSMTGTNNWKFPVELLIKNNLMKDMEEALKHFKSQATRNKTFIDIHFFVEQKHVYVEGHNMVERTVTTCYVTLRSKDNLRRRTFSGIAILNPTDTFNSVVAEKTALQHALKGLDESKVKLVWDYYLKRTRKNAEEK